MPPVLLGLPTEASIWVIWVSNPATVRACSAILASMAPTRTPGHSAGRHCHKQGRLRQPAMHGDAVEHHRSLPNSGRRPPAGRRGENCACALKMRPIWKSTPPHDPALDCSSLRPSIAELTSGP
jgi:hypothetical protein